MEDTPRNTTIAETSALGVERTIRCITAAIRPLCSHRPMPSIATSTDPSGAKPMKLAVMPSKMYLRPSGLSRLLTPTARVTIPPWALS